MAKNVQLTFSKELIFQLVLYTLVFLFYSFDRNHPQISFYQFVFFLNYAFAAFVINYFLLPRFFYLKKYLAFFVGVIIVVLVVIAIEELVLEKIYFPDSRGKSFPGLIYSLLDLSLIHI